MKKLFTSLFLLCFLIFQASKLQAQTCKKCLIIASYNLENLFDTKDDPKIDDAEFLPGSKKEWNEEKYQKKLKNMSEAISKIGGKNGPDVLGLIEVENRTVLEDLIKQPVFSKRKYAIEHFDSPDVRGIDVALLYDSKVIKHEYSTILPITDPFNAEWKTRDILYTILSSGKDTFHIMVNHWPSRRSGDESVARRALASEVARKKVDEILAKNPLAKIILMGDFNDTPQDESIIKGMKAVGKATDLKDIELFDPMTEASAKSEGTHYYDKEWNMLDHFMLSKGMIAGKGYQFLSAQIFKADFLLETNPKYKGQPLRTYVGNKYLGGYSDHLPIYMVLQKK